MRAYAFIDNYNNFSHKALKDIMH